MTPVWTIRNDREALAESVAESLRDTLRDAIKERGQALAALSGGSTPAPVYARLAEHDELDWSAITLTLTDERMAPRGHPARNENILKPLIDKGAGFVPLEDEAMIERLPKFDAVLLGMGADGHTASLFPGAAALETAMDPYGTRMVREIVPPELPPEAPFPRLTLTVPRLCKSRCLLVMITGEEKRRVAEDAIRPGDPLDPPMRGVLTAMPARAEIFWSP